VTTTKMHCLGICALLLAGGCASTGQMSPDHPYDYIYGTSKSELKASIVSRSDLQADEQAYYEAKNKADEAEKRRLRDKIIGELRPFIDEFWRRYVSAFYGSNALVKTSLEATTTTLSGAAAITKPASVASIVSAVSSAVGALGTSIEKNFFQQQTAVVLLHQMEADVKLYGEKIDQGLAKGTDEYPLPAALADLATYSRAMSIPSALASLNASAGAQTQSLKDNTMRQLVQ
jgi:hypothetical protein